MKVLKDYLEYGKKLSDRFNAAFEESSDGEWIEGKEFLRGYKCQKLLSITPYIYNDCSADCLFCSEKLMRNGTVMHGSSISTDYETKLRFILEQLKGNSIFLSLSGKEPSESLAFTERILKIVKEFEADGGHVTDKVIYSNLSGVLTDMEKFLRIAKEYSITSVECSRHHYDEEINQQIMKFRKSAINRNVNFQKTINYLTNYIHVKLVCVIQKGGVANNEDVAKYVKWARSMGIRQVVFRELAMFQQSVEQNRTYDYISKHRAPLMDILETLGDDFKIQKVKVGYYYISFVYKNSNMDISFEMSDYEEMIKKHQGNMIHKLIYYPNGDLCLDWNMQRKIY